MLKHQKSTLYHLLYTKGVTEKVARPVIASIVSKSRNLECEKAKNIRLLWESEVTSIKQYFGIED